MSIAPLICAALLAAGPARADDPFPDRVGMVELASYAAGMAAGDLDGDGTADLVIASPGTDEIVLAFGPRLEDPRRYAVGFGPERVALGDLDGDGALDVAVANEISRDLSIRMGAGDGTLGVEHPVPLGGTPVALAAADLDGDGDADLAVTEQGADRAWILLSRGAARFEVSRILRIVTDAIRIAAGDLDGDGDADLVVANQTEISVLLGQGDGTFPEAIRYEGDRFGSLDGPTLDLADADGDGALDIIFPARDAFVLLFGRGDGSFGAKERLQESESLAGMGAGDVDGDGLVDLIGAGRDAVVIHRGLGGGEFAPAERWPLTEYAGAVALADFDGDGRDDVAVVDRRPHRVLAISSRWLRGEAAVMRFAGDHKLRGASAADLDGHGGAELIVAREERTLEILSGFPEGDVTTEIMTVPRPIGAPGAADLDGDGLVDLVVGDEGGLTVLPAVAPGRFGDPEAYAMPVPASGLEIVDLSGDGRPEILAYDAGSGGELYVFGNDGRSGPTAPPASYTVGSIASLAFGDFDEDGHLDACAGLFFRRPITLLFGKGDGTFRDPVGLEGHVSLVLAAGDFTGDGHLDIAADDGLSGIAILAGGGDGTFELLGHVLQDYGARAMLATDLSGDGVSDLLLTDGEHSFVSYLAANGAGGFLPERGYWTATPPDRLRVGDLDGDGRPDLIALDWGARQVSVLPGRPSGAVPRFVRGDARPDGVLDLADAIAILGYLFGGRPLGCIDAADVDDSGAIDLGDAIACLNYLFAGGPQPVPPFPDCGPDPTPGDALDCEEPSC